MLTYSYIRKNSQQAKICKQKPIQVIKYTTLLVSRTETNQKQKKISLKCLFMHINVFLYIFECLEPIPTKQLYSLLAFDI